MKSVIALSVLCIFLPSFTQETISSSSSENLEAQRRIINGEFARPNEFPFFAEVDNFVDENTVIVCGGALISRKKVLTAAHCLKNMTKLAVEFGSNKKFEGIIYAVDHYEKNTEADLAVLFLKDEVKLTENIKTIEILQRPVIPGEECTAIGYGFNGQEYEKELKYSHLHIDNINEVEALVAPWPLSTIHIYAAMHDNTDVCMGDSGGPLVCNGFLAGTTVGSTVKQPCNAPGFPSKFTNLYKLQEWINKVF